MIPIKWEVRRVGQNEAYPDYGFLIHVWSVQGEREYCCGHYITNRELRLDKNALLLILPRMQDEVMRMIMARVDTYREYSIFAQEKKYVRH